MRPASADDGRHHIERRYYHAGADDEHGVAGEIAPPANDGATRKEEPQRHTARIAQVDVALAEVVEEEPDAAAEDARYHHVQQRIVIHEAHEKEGRSGDNGYPARKSVQTVDEIEGVHEAHDPEDGDRIAEPPQLEGRAEEKVDSLKCDAARDHRDGHGHLDDELHAGFEVDAVVDYAEDDDDGPPDQERSEPERHVRSHVAVEPQCEYQRCGGREEYDDAAGRGNRARACAARAWKVHETHPQPEPGDRLHEQPRQRRG